MSSSLAQLLAKFHQGTVLGPPTFDPKGHLPNVVVYPIFPATLHPDPPDMITLSDALDRGVKLNDTGLVGRVHIDNPLPTTILAGESEILMGQTQMRSMQYSCLVPGGRRASLPVNCVEEGRPTEYQAEFVDTDACPWSLRSFKMEQLAQRGETEQTAIWDQVEDFLHTANTSSKTKDLHAVFNRFSGEIGSIGDIFPRRPGQVGAICAVGPHLFLEVFGAPELLEDRYANLLHSALVEAIVYPGDAVLPSAQVAQFLPELIAVSRDSAIMQNRSLKGTGRTEAFNGQGITGSALAADGELVHLSAHKKCLGRSQPFTALRDDLIEQQSQWENEHASFVKDLTQSYNRRRQRYESFKDGLAPIRNPDIERGAVLPYDEMAIPSTGQNNAPPAPRPQPLSKGLHDFFLDLFRRP